MHKKILDEAESLMSALRVTAKESLELLEALQKALKEAEVEAEPTLHPLPAKEIVLQMSDEVKTAAIVDAMGWSIHKDMGSTQWVMHTGLDSPSYFIDKPYCPNLYLGQNFYLAWQAFQVAATNNRHKISEHRHIAMEFDDIVWDLFETPEEEQLDHVYYQSYPVFTHDWDYVQRSILDGLLEMYIKYELVNPYKFDWHREFIHPLKEIDE